MLAFLLLRADLTRLADVARALPALDEHDATTRERCACELSELVGRARAHAEAVPEADLAACSPCITQSEAEEIERIAAHLADSHRSLRCHRTRLGHALAEVVEAAGVRELFSGRAA